MQISGGIYRSRKLFQPPGLSTRPTSHKLRSALFNIIQHRVDGSLFLDLFAGVGAVGLEAISRGAVDAYFVEKDPTPFKLIKKNVEHLGCQKQCHIYFGDCLKILERDLKHLQFDIIYADPPYGLKLKDEYYSEKLIKTLLELNLLKPEGDLFIEEGLDSLKFDGLKLISLRNYGKSFLYHFTTL